MVRLLENVTRREKEETSKSFHVKLRRHGLGQLAAKRKKVRVVAAAGARLHHGPERFLGRWSGYRRNRRQPIFSVDWSAGTAPQKGELLHAGRDLRRTQAANKFKKTPPDLSWEPPGRQKLDIRLHARRGGRRGAYLGGTTPEELDPAENATDVKPDIGRTQPDTSSGSSGRNVTRREKEETSKSFHVKLRRHGLGQLAAKKRKVRVVPRLVLVCTTGRNGPLAVGAATVETVASRSSRLIGVPERHHRRESFYTPDGTCDGRKRPTSLRKRPRITTGGVVLDCWNAANCPVRATRSTEARHSAPRASGRSTRSVSWWNDTRGARPGRERDRRQARHRAYATGHVERIVRKVYARSGPVLTNPVRRWWLTRTRRVGPWRDSSDKVRCSLERLEQRIMGPKKTKKNSE
ncbi:hypothetical protein pipiens_006057 [Culex pipiens pipiens]|uniref:Uncharacterized protein n=1 Tax=Culex pipiens pipiens TaxID=38569 RepID=A0ABD1DSH2_CULPP